MENIQFDFIVTGWTIEEAKAFYDSIVDHLEREHTVTGGVCIANQDDPLYEEADHETG